MKRPIIFGRSMTHSVRRVPIDVIVFLPPCDLSVRSEGKLTKTTRRTDVALRSVARGNLACSMAHTVPLVN